MTTRIALKIAQQAYPLDLVGRLGFMQKCVDGALERKRPDLARPWQRALDLTRDGQTETRRP